MREKAHGSGREARSGVTRRRACGLWCASMLAMAAVWVWGAPAQAALVHPFSSQLRGRPHQPFSSLLCGVDVDPASGEVYVADAGAVAKEEEERPAIEVFSSGGSFLGKIDKLGKVPETENEFFSFREACSTAINDTTHHVYVTNDGEGEGIEENEKEAVFVYTAASGKFTF